MNYENENEVIIRTFVPLPSSAHCEDIVIKNTFNRIQNENSPIIWPQINDKPVNEFQTPGYIACTFPTLYPTESVDLQAARVWKVKPTEYFKYLLLYKDGRFARHTRW